MAVKKRSKIADTTFKTGQDGSLATPDIYAKPPQEPVGATTSVSEAGGGLDIGKMTGIPGTSPILPGGFDPAKIKSVTDTIGKVMSQVAEGKNPLSAESLKNLSPETIGKMASAMGYPQIAQLPSMTKKIDYTNPEFLDNLAKSNPYAKAVIDGKNFLVKAKDIKDVNGLMALAGEFTGNKEIASVLNIKNEMAIAKVLIDSINAAGIPALGKKIIDNFKDSKEKRQLALNTTGSLAAGSHLEELNAVVDEYGSDAVKLSNSTLVLNLLTNYTNPLATPDNPKQPNPSDLLAKLLESLNKIDPNWKYTKRNGVNVYNLDVFSQLSVDAFNLFSIDPELKIPTTTSKEYLTNMFTNSLTMLEQQYPYTKLTA